MGLLDDAIREHLELKRRRGADLEELSRQEAEALGPARRGEASAAPAVADPPAAPREAPPAEHEDAPTAAPPEPALDEPATAYAPPEPELRHEPAPAPEPPRTSEPGPQPRADSPPLPPPPPAARRTPDPEPPAAAAPPAPSPPAPAPDPRPLLDDAQSTREFSAEEVADAASERDPDLVPGDDAGEHDELEETPDFLQETPEHDRLWFEQKPPKDFDF